MRLLNYTTKAPAEQTIGEIQKMLMKHGISGMLTEYESGQVSSVSFRLNVDGKNMSFRLPCNWRGVCEILKGSEYSRIPHHQKEEQAVKVAWRIIKDWVEAQLALIEVNMVTLPQVFLPYAIMKNGQTLSEHIVSNPQFLLEK